MSRFIATISSSVVSGRSTAASIRLRVPRWSIASTANVPASVAIASSPVFVMGWPP